MTTDALEYMAEVFGARTKGVHLMHRYTDEPPEKILDAISKMLLRGGAFWHWVAYRKPGDTKDIVVCETGNGPTSEGNARFIALAGTCADEIAEVVDASRRLTRGLAPIEYKMLGENTTMRLDSLNKALANLRAKIEGSRG